LIPHRRSSTSLIFLITAGFTRVMVYETFRLWVHKLIPNFHPESRRKEDKCDTCAELKIRLNTCSSEEEKSFYTAQLQSHRDDAVTEREFMDTRNKDSRTSYPPCRPRSMTFIILFHTQILGAG